MLSRAKHPALGSRGKFAGMRFLACLRGQDWDNEEGGNKEGVRSRRPLADRNVCPTKIRGISRSLATLPSASLPSLSFRVNRTGRMTSACGFCGNYGFWVSLFGVKNTLREKTAVKTAETLDK
jgi:hypothetical protein